MKKIKLGDLCVPSAGQLKKDSDELIDYIDISSVDNETKKVTGYQTLLFEEAPSRARKTVKKGSILVSTVRPNLNAVAMLEEDTPNISVASTGFCVLDSKENVDNRFILNFCKSKTFINAMVAQATGASYPAVSDKIVRAALVPDYTYEEQCNISEVLDKVSNVIEKRKAELCSLDDLIKARFVEMFGDARKNPNKYDTVSFIDIVEYMGDIGSNGANKVVVDHLDMKDKEDYAMMVRFTNFTKNDFTDDVKYVSKEAYDFFKKSQIFGGELIICKIGSAGQNYVMPYLNRPVSLGLNQIMVRIKDNILMPYLYQYLHTDYGEFLISGCINGAVTKTITKTELKKIPVMLPPMELQREFVAFVEQVDKSKVVVQKAFDETQMLYDSLLQEFFG